jgi:hypothetical protein
VRGVAQLHADREIKPCWAAAEASNLHAMPPFLFITAAWHRQGIVSSLNI